MSKNLACVFCCLLFVGSSLAVPSQQSPEQVLSAAPAVAPVEDVDHPAAVKVQDVDQPALVYDVDHPAPAPVNDVDHPAPATNAVQTKPTQLSLPNIPTLLSTSTSLEQAVNPTKCDCECAIICVAPTITYNSVKLDSNAGVISNRNTIQSRIDAGNTLAGYCSTSLPSMFLHSNQRLCSGGTNSNIGQKFTITFSEPTGGVTWNFRVNVDAGYGYIVYLDGVSLGQIDVDVWAGGTNPRLWTKTGVAAGQHILELYGGEGCCDGEAGAWQFQRGSAEFQTISVGNLNSACIVSPRISYFSTALSPAANQGNDLNKVTIENAYVSTSPAATGSYCARSLSDMSVHSNQRICTTNNNQNIGQRFQIDFQESGTNALWKFRINMDSGYGYSVYLDGIKAGQFVGDVWAGITNPFTFVFEDVDTGPHRLVVYGGEGCCDGEAGGWKVERNNQDFIDLTVANLDILSRRTDRNPPINFYALRANLRYFSTFLPNQGSTEANREFIESHMLPATLTGGLAYCSRAISDVSAHSNQRLCKDGSNQNIGQRFVIRFIEPRGGVPWSFRINMDSGYGYTVYYDYGIKVGSKDMDVWSSGTNPTTWTLNSVDAGVHKLVIYGGEGCCDGEAGGWQFSRNNGALQSLTSAALITIADSAGIFYFSTFLPSNQGTPLDNQFYIENKYLNKQNNGAGYCSWKGDSFASHNNQGMCPGGSNSNIGQRFEIFFREKEAGGVKWDFRVFMDSGYGHAAFFDGEFLDQRVGDVWSGDTNPTVYSIPSVPAGFHRFVVYGGEGCCDGKAGDWQFQRKGTGYKALNAANLNAAS